MKECPDSVQQALLLAAFDLAEVVPPYDHSQLTAQVAARLMQDILAARFPS